MVRSQDQRWYHPWFVLGEWRENNVQDTMETCRETRLDTWPKLAVHGKLREKIQWNFCKVPSYHSSLIQMTYNFVNNVSILHKRYHGSCRSGLNTPVDTEKGWMNVTMPRGKPDWDVHLTRLQTFRKWKKWQIWMQYSLLEFTNFCQRKVRKVSWKWIWSDLWIWLNSDWIRLNILLKGHREYF